MKKFLLTLSGIFIISSVSAQVKKGYGQKYTKAKNSKAAKNSNNLNTTDIAVGGDWADAKKFADKMAVASGKYVFLQQKESASSDMLILRYISSSVIKKDAYLNKTCKECIDIEFKKNPKEKYTFSHVWGNFADLFPVWKSLFSPNAQKSDYMVSDQNVLAQWQTSYGKDRVTFGRLGTAWFIKIEK